MRRRSIKRMASLLAASMFATCLVAVFTGQAAFALASCPAHWELGVVTNYGQKFKAVWSAPLYINQTSIVQGPFTYTSTYSGTVSSTASSSLDVSLSTDISSISAQLGISLSTTKEFDSGVSNSFSAPADKTLHIEYGEIQYETYDEHDYVTSTCQITEATYGYSYSDWKPAWKVWTTAA